MIRLFTLMVNASLLLLLLAVSANATPIVGGRIGVSQSFKTNAGGVFNSSLTGRPLTSSNHGIGGTQGLIQGNGFAPHQFSERVPPPTASETPEPSTLALFGTGLLMLGGVVRRKFVS